MSFKFQPLKDGRVQLQRFNDDGTLVESWLLDSGFPCEVCGSPFDHGSYIEIMGATVRLTCEVGHFREVAAERHDAPGC